MENLTCAAHYIQGPVELPYSATFSSTLRVIQAVVFLFLFVAGFLLNSLVIGLVVIYKKLHTYSILIALQIVLLDLLISVTYLLSIINIIANRWLLGEFMCAVVGMLLFTSALVRTFLMFVFVVDRYLSVFQTAHYTKHKVKIILCLSAASWLVSLLLRIPLLPGLLDCYSFTPLAWLCAFDSSCNKICSVYSIVYVIIVVVPLTIIPVVLYTKLYCSGWKVCNSKSEASNLHQREQKDTLTFFLLFISVLILTLPNILISVTIRRVYAGKDISPIAYVVLIVSISSLSLLIITDPLVIMRNWKIREILSRLKAAAIQKCQRRNHTVITVH